MRIMEIKNGRVPCPKFLTTVDVEVGCWNCPYCQSMEDGLLMCDVRY
jgi:uncharacterized protein (UPF0212 family)